MNDVATSTNELRVLSVCSGAGGLELGLRIAGLPTRVVGYVEREVSVVDILAARFEDGTLEPAPVWSDVRTVHTVLDAFGPIDAVVGGYPCQPFSHAGRRAGADDPRHLWPAIRDLVERIGPALCVFENVDGHVTKGLDVVVGDLEDLGYLVEAEIVSAAEVGAPHLRKRLFIAAVADSDASRRGFVGGGGLLDGLGAPHRHDPDGQSGPPVAALVHPADAVGRALGTGLDGRSERLDRDGQADGRPRVADATLVDTIGGAAQRRGIDGVVRDAPSVAHCEGDQRQRSGHAADDAGEAVVNAPRDGRPERWSEWAGSEGRHEPVDAGGAPAYPVFPPGPDDPAWFDILAFDASVAPALPDLGGRSGKEVLAAQPAIRDLADGLASRLDDILTDRAERLQALGNGVVPQCAGVAVRLLLDRIQNRLKRSSKPCSHTGG